MKPFDKVAAMRGARVCTRGGHTVRILCFDSEGLGCRRNPQPIVADIYCSIKPVITITISFQEDGLIDPVFNKEYDLMMADDDYLDKLERGEYGTPATPAAPIPAPAPIPDRWDEFKRQAALELIRIMGAPIGSRYVTDIVEKVNGIADGLKSK